MICGRGMSSDAGGRPEVKGMTAHTAHPPEVCSRVYVIYISMRHYVLTTSSDIHRRMFAYGSVFELLIC